MTRNKFIEAILGIVFFTLVITPVKASPYVFIPQNILMPQNIYNSDIAVKGEYFIRKVSNIITVWDINNRQLIAEITTKHYISAFDITSNGRYLAFSEYLDGSSIVKIWDLKNRKVLKIFRVSDRVNALALDSKGKYIAIAYYDLIEIWNIKTGKFLNRFMCSTMVLLLEISENSKYLLAGASAKGTTSIKLWNLQEGKLLFDYDCYLSDTLLGEELRDATLTSDNKYVVATTSPLQDLSMYVKIWRISDGKLIRKFNLGEVFESLVSSNSPYVVTIEDAIIKVWNYYNGELKYTIKGSYYDEHYLSGYLSHDTPYLAVISERESGASIKLWNLLTGKPLKQFTENKELTNVILSQGNRYLIASSLWNDKSNIEIWDIQIGQLVKEFQDSETVFSIAIDPEEKYLVAAYTTYIKLWDIKTGQLLRKIAFKENVEILDVSINGDYLIVAGANDTYAAVLTWNIKESKLLRHFHVDGKVSELKIVPNTYYIAINKGDTLEVWDCTGLLMHKYYYGPAEVSITEDGRYAFFNTLLIDLATGEEIGKFNIDTYDTKLAEVSPGNSYLVDIEQGALKIWSMRSGELMKVYTVEGDVVSLATTSNDRYVVIGYENGIIRIWPLKVELKLIRQFSEVKGAKYAFIDAKDTVIAIIKDGGVINLRNYKTGELLRESSIDESELYQIVGFVAKGDKYIFTEHFDNTIKLWNLSDGKLTKTFHGAQIFLSQDQNFSAIVNDLTGNIEVWDIKNDTSVWNFTEYYYDMDYLNSLSSKYLVYFYPLSSETGLIKIWDIRQKQLKFCWIAELMESQNIENITISPNNSFIIAETENGYVYIWGIQGNFINFFRPEDSIYEMLLSNDGKYIICLLSNNNIEIWSMDGEFVQKIELSDVGKVISTDVYNDHLLLLDERGQVLEKYIGKQTNNFWLYSGPSADWVVACNDGKWDANEKGEKYVGIREIGTLTVYRPGDIKCDNLRTRNLFKLLWTSQE